MIHVPIRNRFQNVLYQSGFLPVQDFSQEGAPTSGGGANVRFCQNFPKLHEIERIWTPGAGGASLVPPLDPLLPVDDVIRLSTDLRLIHLISLVKSA